MLISTCAICRSRSLQALLRLPYGTYDFDINPEVGLLIRKGADVTAAFEDGQTVLDKAASWGYADSARLLLAAGVDPNPRDRRQRTPLDAAFGAAAPCDSYKWEVYGNKAATVAMLLAAGADAGVADAEGNTPTQLLARLLYAAASNFVPFEVSYDPYERSSWPELPRWNAMARTVGALVAAGSDIYAKDRAGRTARAALIEFIIATFGQPALDALLTPPQPQLSAAEHFLPANGSKAQSRPPAAASSGAPTATEATQVGLD